MSVKTCPFLTWGLVLSALSAVLFRTQPDTDDFLRAGYVIGFALSGWYGIGLILVSVRDWLCWRLDDDSIVDEVPWFCLVAGAPITVLGILYVLWNAVSWQMDTAAAQLSAIYVPPVAHPAIEDARIREQLERLKLDFSALQAECAAETAKQLKEEKKKKKARALSTREERWYATSPQKPVSAFDHDYGFEYFEYREYFTRNKENK